jgi:hypothetical protein
MAVDSAGVAARVCCAGGGGDAVFIRLVYPPQDVEASESSSAVAMTGLFVLSAFIGDQALSSAPDAMVSQLGESCEEGGRASWGSNVFDFTCAGVGLPSRYSVAGYVRHVASPDVPVEVRMQAGGVGSGLPPGAFRDRALAGDNDANATGRVA